MATYIGYPIPFFVVLTLIPWTPIVVAMGAFILRDQLRQEPSIRRAILQYTQVFNAQSFLTIIYPLYSYVFNTFPHWQTSLSLLLPVMKLAFKNWFAHASRHIADVKPELVVFNVEIFSALYVSSCMRRATSIYTTVVIMSVDFIQACLSVNDLNNILEDRHLREALVRQHQSVQTETCVTQRNSLSSAVTSFRTFMPLVPPVAAPVDYSLPSKSPDLSTQSPVLRMLWHNAKIRVLPLDPRAIATLRGRHFRRPAITADPMLLHEIASRLSHQEQLMVVQRTLRIFHIAEFISLVEYSEVAVPIVYSIFSIVAFTFPDRQFYLSMNEASLSEFVGTLSNVLLFGALELVSFMALDQVMRRKFGVSAFRQTAFVLESQWSVVQAKLMLWMIVVLQLAHEHYGADFSFQFKWLHQQHTSQGT